MNGEINENEMAKGKMDQQYYFRLVNIICASPIMEKSHCIP